MKFHQSIFQNNSFNKFKFFFLIIFIFLLSFKVNTEIPEKYKIESSLPKCKGKDYAKWTNCYGEYEFPRIEYKGEWKDGKLHGKGILKEAWGAIYVGDFKNNMSDGYGRQEELDGTWWEGEIKDDLLHGKATYYDSSSKCIEEGNWKNFKLDGQATITCEDGYFVEGNFKESLLHGQGFLKYSSGTKYSGEFINGQLNGQGEIKWSNGNFEKGNFKNDLLDGMGTYVFYYGNKYEGKFLKGKFHGKGKYIWSNGDYFEGTFKNDLKVYGTFYYNNGDKLTGDLKNDEINGFATLIKFDGDKYEGEYLDGFKHGKGIYTWIDGDKYEGDFLEGFRTGKGKYTYKSGTVYEGDFLKNFGEGNGKYTYYTGEVYVGEVKEGYEHGQGTMEFPNGDVYVGQWKDGYEHGQGKMLYANGNVYEGLFEDGKEVKGRSTLAKFTTDEKYYALIIGNNDYDKLEDLDNAINDAKDLEKVLREKYGFKTTLLLNQTSDETEDAIIAFTENREKNDNILIYYAGHGQKMKKQKLERGYWLPTDAGSKRDSKWISNSNIKDYIGSSDAKHILLIVDSCFSGSLMRGSGENKSIEKLSKPTIERLKSKITRLVITSGGNELVADGIGDSKNSVFAEPLIKFLKNNNDVIRSIELFQKVQSYVINNADQTPNHSLIHGTGHDGGEFLFFPKS